SATASWPMWWYIRMGRSNGAVIGVPGEAEGADDWAVCCEASGMPTSGLESPRSGRSASAANSVTNPSTATPRIPTRTGEPSQLKAARGPPDGTRAPRLGSRASGRDLHSARRVGIANQQTQALIQRKGRAPAAGSQKRRRIEHRVLDVPGAPRPELKR